MGSSSSVVSGRDHNIEMNIVDEAQSNGRGSMQRHNSQPSNTLFSGFKPRQKHQENTFRSSNLPSSNSFDSSTPPSVGPGGTVGNVKKEYDTLKLTKEQEIQALQRKEQKLDMENSRLRAEVHALNKQCQKLKIERNTAMESSYLATERATALEEDREKIQRQFKIFRETKEAEIQALLQAKRQLESDFHHLQAQGMATIDDHGSVQHDATSTMHKSVQRDDHSHWWAAPESETTSLFGSYAQLQNGSQVGYSESVLDVQDISKVNQSQVGNLGASPQPSYNDNWLSTSASLSNLLVANVTEICDSSILRCYISSTPDVINEAVSFVHSPDLKRLKMTCEKEDHPDYSTAVQSCDEPIAIHNALTQTLSKSSVFVGFLGRTLGKYTALEYEEAHFKSPGSKSVLFCIKNFPQYSKKCDESLISEVRSTSKRCVPYDSSEEGCAAAVKEISKAIRLEFGVRLETDFSSPIDPNDVVHLDETMVDPHMERTQVEIATISNHVQPIGLEKSFDRLDEVIASPGPVPPLLVSGSRGSGKTLLLSSWTMRLKSNRPDVLVLQHFITNQNSINAQPVIALSRLLSQLCHHLPPGSHPPLQSSSYDAKRLRDTLPRWIDQLSSRRNKRILLVVDSIDRLKDVQRYFSWLMDPFPVGVRVIISVDVDSCPEEWRQFPTLHLEPLSIHAVKLLLKEHVRMREANISQNWERDVVSQCRTATTCHPLFVILLSSLVCSIDEGWVSDNLFHVCSKKQDAKELYHVFLKDIELRCSTKEAKQRLKLFLQFLICSRNGVSETEVMSLLPDMTWQEWIDLSFQLSRFCIVKEQAGVIVAHNSEVFDFLTRKFLGNDVYERKCRQKMITCLMKMHKEQITPRSTDLLLWLLQKEEERTALLEVLKSPVVFNILYTSGRNSEVVELWTYLNEDKHAITKYYTSELRKMESSGSMASMAEVAQIYQSLGRFQKDMGLMEEAVFSLQKSLEIKETALDPDHPAVANSLHYLASVYAQWGKLTTAESLYKQALELIESTVGPEHLRAAQELGALSRIARKAGRQQAAESLHRREVAIAAKSAGHASARVERLRKRALRLEELTLGDDSVEMANALNDLGVLYHLQNNLENAESFFLRCLKIREKLAGPQHVDIAQSLHNLASVYNQKKDYPRAVQCMDRALTIRKHHFGNDISVLNTLRHLAVLHKKAKNLDSACEVYAELVELETERNGDDSTLAANAMVNLAVAECQNGRLDVALPLYKKALKIYEESYGRESSQVTQTLKNIAVLLYQKGDFNEAALVYKESMGDKYDSSKVTKAW